MDRPPAELVDFTIIPIETVAASVHILNAVDNALHDNTYTVQPQKDRNLAIFRGSGNDLIQNTSRWPLIVQENSQIHTTIIELHETALCWLDCSPIFDEGRDNLRMFLSLQRGFKASGLQAKRGRQYQEPRGHLSQAVKVEPNQRRYMAAAV